ncbi:Serine/threonine-protein kinase AfsK [Thalassoglobus neptunius]|uniref:Serine/threonine-protein kinase AfsK n=1 Tax=Thalassoglobus neptunius TaxID=1938619 RepID=A0A5C5WML1_9PLAN|nr:PQQ-binding-like beta-propeller repeat protein [Thalassoglobus neptunius]TWT51858.1 Serine/threonine-protein kinase AfsK [Thalassoglobus neptunius]
MRIPSLFSPLLNSARSIHLAACLVACCILVLNGSKANAIDAEEILSKTGVRGGFIVQLGLGDGSLTSDLKASDAFQVHGLDRDPETVRKIRNELHKSGVYGAVSVDQRSSTELPYIDNLVNLLVAEDLGDVPMSEVMRVLVPNGTAFLKGEDGNWTATVKPRPDDIDEWSHFFHDASGNAVAHDDVVGPPRHLQWVGSPRWSRHHDRMASMSALVSSGGRLFYIQDEGSRISIQLPPKWKLIGRDAFNGTVLWKRDIESWQDHLWPLKSGPTQLSRRLVSTEDEVYVTLGIDAPVSVVDAATGETLRTLKDSDGTEEIIVSNGTIYLVVNKEGSARDAYIPLNGGVGDQAHVRENFFWNEEPRVVMAYDAESGEQLWAKTTRISPLTMAADQEKVYLHDGSQIVAIDGKSGEVDWQTSSVTRRKEYTFNFGPRLLIHEGVVLYAGGDNKMVALEASDGKELWTSEHPNSGYQSPQDLMVVDGLVWVAPTTSGKDTGIFTGRDPRTGEVKKSFEPDVDTYWFHHRCYISKATDNYLMPSRTGIEFVDYENEHWDIHHWVRGGCLYGVMPCNGLTYAPAHNCACYPEAKLFGFNALAPAAPTRPRPLDVPEEGRLEIGPSFDRPLSPIDEASFGVDWPTYRSDSARSGFLTTRVPSELTESWKITLGGELTPPVIAEDHVYVAQKDTHTLFALDVATGETAWQYTIGARIDSPPTVQRGRVVFGGNDGWVYCLASDDGSLCWRYRAAPLDRRTIAFEQLESLWPVHGSVLFENDSIYAVAGRSNFLDGGLRLVRLDLKSGKKLTETLMDETNPATGNNLQELVKVLQMPVGLPDILSSDGERIYMRSQKFDQDGNRLEIGPVSGDFVEQGSAQRGEGVHLFAPMGFLDDTWFHRAYWVNGRSFAGGHAGYYQAGKFAPAGRILVNGGGYVYGYGRKPQYYKWTTVLEHQLFASPPEPPEVKITKATTNNNNGSFAQFKPTAHLDPTGKPITVEAWFNATKPNGVIVARGGPTDGFALALKNGRLGFHVRSDFEHASISDSKRVIGGWHHAVGVLNDDAQMTLYVDGEEVAQGTAKGLLATNPKQALEIGSDEGTAAGDYKGQNGFTGSIDEVRLYFSATSAEKIRERYMDGVELADDPVLSVSFDNENSKDESEYSNPGTLKSGKPVPGKFGNAMMFVAKARRSGGNRNAMASQLQPKWTADIPIYVRGMCLAERTLFIVGPADIIDEEETFKQITEQDQSVVALLARQDEILAGKEGCQLLAVNADTGEIDGTVDLKTLPAWDGLAAAQEKLFLSTLDGDVICFVGEEE